ncbi:hypothetical protein I307_03287 [Cryptococcus deuterogattii 99/473]|uniref:Uncharacterized protein n=2 Tax=Cryptococcus deuterogattii TaxID=1859096 RepID=A0A0D0TYL6_9TREE|nr:hypothetical protein CNBG_5980 [Cryptococcus deuterogattii R265]KIR26579.1 hypothetical protein I309_04548 [Cryptococcus deuterogattii LA55]KIR33111.1 hypothetical protein I352_04480 [Cryptococcus deuterogattii MMRL2647]KIR41013.1 hypothetical protein I313_02961 [Cryptococcus deuterogattii Ram5]KIR72368.1 hypothetical protein I310_03772 [Cryptococcus deuterogattii CA1014]KIR91961.1 hypothetical protein I304_04125 [Cryptococcus deuterogattii CBS 10090]KIR97773.1 hypothetical protein L804_04
MIDSSPHLTWTNVFIGFLFVIFDSVLSIILGLGIASSLLIAAVRCVIQLSIMGLVLGKVFASNNIWGVAGIAVLLNVLAAIEATYNKAKRRFSNMFPLILLAMMSGTVPVSILGTNFAMAQHPFWKPDQFIPIIGMILGNAISAVGLAVNNVHKEFAENKDRIETYLAMGASRFEACRPVAVEALKMALLPTVNQLSVIGLVSLPGMMTGAIVGGKSVEQAARLQMIIMFMISASSALCTLLALFFCLTTLVDSRARLRPDKMYSKAPLLYRWRDAAGERIWNGLKKVMFWRRKERGTEEERRGLLNGQSR